MEKRTEVFGKELLGCLFYLKWKKYLNIERDQIRAA